MSYDSVRREVLYSILVGYGVAMNVVQQFETCLNEIYSRVCVSINLFDISPIQNGLKRGGALKTLLSNFALEYAIRKIHEN
jgi:hypothetical protein